MMRFDQSESDRIEAAGEVELLVEADAWADRVLELIPQHPPALVMKRLVKIIQDFRAMEDGSFI